MRLAALIRSLIPIEAVQPRRVTNQLLSVRDPAGWEFGEDSYDRQSAAGVRVTHKLALTVGPVMNAVGMLSCDLAAAPLHVHFTQKKPGQDTIDQRHPADKICSLQANNETSAFQFWSTFIQHVTLFGSGFAFIERDRTVFGSGRDRDWGRVTGMYNLLPDRTDQYQAQKSDFVRGVANSLYVTAGEKYYVTEVGAGLFAFRWNDILHVNWLNLFPGKFPMLDLIRDDVGHKLAARGFESKFFANGAQAGGFVKIPPGMKREAQDNLKKQLRRKQSPDAWFRLMVLADGAEFTKATIDPKSAEMGIVDKRVAYSISMMYRIPPQKMGLEGGQVYKAGESAQLSYVTGVLNHLGKAVQGECYIKLLSPKTRAATVGEDDSRKFEHDFSELTKPDWGTRVGKLIELRAAEVHNANDVLFRMGEPLRDDELAEKYYNPTTMGRQENDDAEEPDSGTEETDEPEEDAGEDQRTARRNLHIEAIDRAAKRICTLSTNRCKRLNDFQALVTNRFGEFQPIFDEELSSTLSLTHPGNTQAVLATASKEFFEDLTDRMTSTMLDMDFVPGFDAKALRSAVRASGEGFQANITSTLADGVLSTGQHGGVR